jgi:hypothetical protein
MFMKKALAIIVFLWMPFITFSQVLEDLDIIAPYNEGLAAVKKGDQWGFIDEKGNLVIDFRDDLVWNEKAIETNTDITGIRYPQFKNGRCLIRELLKDEEIYVYGFMDTSGNTVIKPEYLNVTQFDQGYAIGILMTKTLRGKNEFQLDIFQYRFSEVILNTSGEVMRLITLRDHIQMSKKRYTLPDLRARLVNPELLMIMNEKNKWEVRKLEL